LKSKAEGVIFSVMATGPTLPVEVLAVTAGLGEGAGWLVSEQLARSKASHPIIIKLDILRPNCIFPQKKFCLNIQPIEEETNITEHRHNR